MQVFNRENGRYLGELKSKNNGLLLIQNPFGQQITLAEEAVILDTVRAEELRKKDYQDPQKRAMQEALNSKDYAGKTLSSAKRIFVIALLVFCGGVACKMIYNLMGLSEPPYMGWAIIGGLGFMFTNGIRILKYRWRLKTK